MYSSDQGVLAKNLPSQSRIGRNRKLDNWRIAINKIVRHSPPHYRRRHTDIKLGFEHSLAKDLNLGMDANCRRQIFSKPGCIPKVGEILHPRLFTDAKSYSRIGEKPLECCEKAKPYLTGKSVERITQPNGINADRGQ